MERSIGTTYKPITKTEVITLTATKIRLETITRKTKVPGTKTEVETKTVCTAVSKCHGYGCSVPG